MKIAKWAGSEKNADGRSIDKSSTPLFISNHGRKISLLKEPVIIKDMRCHTTTIAAILPMRYAVLTNTPTLHFFTTNISGKKHKIIDQKLWNIRVILNHTVPFINIYAVEIMVRKKIVMNNWLSSFCINLLRESNNKNKKPITNIMAIAKFVPGKKSYTASAGDATTEIVKIYFSFFSTL